MYQVKYAHTQKKKKLSQAPKTYKFSQKIKNTYSDIYIYIKIEHKNHDNSLQLLALY